MTAVDLKVLFPAQKALHELIDRLDGIEAVQGDGILDAGIVGVEGQDVVNAHADQFLQSDGAVQGLPSGTDLLSGLVEIGHDDGDAPGLAAGSGDDPLEVGEMIVRRHVVVVAEHPVGLAEVDNVDKDIQVHAAHGVGKNTLAFAGTETGELGFHDIGVTLVIVVGGVVLVLSRPFRTPVDKVAVNLFGHFLFACYGNQSQLSYGKAFKITFVVSSDWFH